MPDTAFNYEQARIDARADNPYVRRKLAGNPTVPPEILNLLVTDSALDVRRALAQNEAAPVAANSLLARDKDYGVRCVLARKVVGDGLADDQRTNLWRACFTILETLAHDKMVRVRRILAEAFMLAPDAPVGIVQTLARDKKREVAAPILSNSPVLSEGDIVDIIDTRPPVWAEAAIASRPTVSRAVADAQERSGSVKAVTTMLANHRAEIGHPTMERIVDRAPKVPQWHEPLVMRPALADGFLIRLAAFVAVPLLAILKSRKGLSASVAGRLDQAAAARNGAAPAAANGGPGTAGPAGSAADHAQELHAAGRLSDEMVSAALDRADREFVIMALALRGKCTIAKVQRIVASKSPRTMTALAWKAGFTAASR